jgi:hypothetical protein
MSEDLFFVKCPHCQGDVSVAREEINCGIFRHGVFKDTHQPIDPHLSKRNCEKLVSQGLIYGCGKPFRILLIEDKIDVSICDYI